MVYLWVSIFIKDTQSLNKWFRYLSHSHLNSGFSKQHVDMRTCECTHVEPIQLCSLIMLSISLMTTRSSKIFQHRSDHFLIPDYKMPENTREQAFQIWTVFLFLFLHFTIMYNISIDAVLGILTRQFDSFGVTINTIIPKKSILKHLWSAFVSYTFANTTY